GEVGVAGAGDLSVEDDEAGVEEVDDAGEGFADEVGGALEQVAAGLVAVLGGVDDVDGVQGRGAGEQVGQDRAVSVVGGLDRVTDDGCPAGERLQAAPIAAAAHHRRVGRVGGGGHVADV